MTLISPETLFPPLLSIYTPTWGRVNSSTVAALPASDADTTGRIARVTDEDRGLWFDTGEGWASSNQRIFNVQDYGAVGDGVTDDTAAIQAAVDAAYQVTGVSNNITAIIDIPRGVYLVRGIVIMNVNGPGGHGCATYLRGAGIGNSWLVLKSGSNAPVIQLGGPASENSTSFVVLQDFAIDGNKSHQSIDCDGIYARRVDRSVISRVYINYCRRNGLRMVGSTIACSSVESYFSGVDGGVVDASNSVSFADCFFNNNAGWGLTVSYTNAGITGAPPVTSAELVEVYVTDGNHFEQNDGGEIHLDGVQNVTIENNRINPKGGVSPSILVDGVSIQNRLLGNWFIGADPGTAPSGSSVDDYNYISFGPLTWGNIYGWNSIVHVVTGPTYLRNQVYDQGANNSLEMDNFSPTQFGGLAGGHALGGWSVQGLTNYALYSEDLSNAAWVKVNVDSVSQADTNRNPWSNAPSGPYSTASVVSFAAGHGDPVPICTLTQTIAGLPFVAGDLITFSIWERLNNWLPGQATDVRLRILDNTNTVLVDRSYRPKTPWTRYYASVVAAGSLSTLKVQIYKVSRSSSDEVAFWGAQLCGGPLGAYVPTTSTATTTYPGFYAPRLVATKGFQVGVGSALLTKILSQTNSLNFGSIGNGVTVLPAAYSMPGAVVGDHVLVAHTGIEVGSVFMVGSVIATDEVQVSITNLSGSSQTVNGNVVITLMHVVTEP